MPARDAARTPFPPTGRTGADRLRARTERLWRTRVLARRRGLAAALAGVAVLAGLRATAAPPPPSDHLWVAAHDVAAGTVLGETDLVRVAWPGDTTPDGALTKPVGRTVTAGLRRGEPVTDARVVNDSMMAAHPGRVALPVRVPDPTTVGMLRVGDRVDLMAADPAEGTARTVARGALVVALSRDSAGGAVPAGRVVVVALAPDEVADVGVAAVRDFVTVAWRDDGAAGSSPGRDPTGARTTAGAISR